MVASTKMLSYQASPLAGKTCLAVPSLVGTDQIVQFCQSRKPSTELPGEAIKIQRGGYGGSTNALIKLQRAQVYARFLALKILFGLVIYFNRLIVINDVMKSRR